MVLNDVMHLKKAARGLSASGIETYTMCTMYICLAYMYLMSSFVAIKKHAMGLCTQTLNLHNIAYDIFVYGLVSITLP